MTHTNVTWCWASTDAAADSQSALLTFILTKRSDTFYRKSDTFRKSATVSAAVTSVLETMRRWIPVSTSPSTFDPVLALSFLNCLNEC